MTDSILKDIKERNNSLKSFKKDGNNDSYIKFNGMFADLLWSTTR